MKPTLKITSDFTNEFNETVKKFKRDVVLVGIPEADTKRDKGPEVAEAITNATILAINEFGSPENNIPPRPVMAIGIRDAQEQIADGFSVAIKNAFKKGLSSLSIYYNRIGIVASNSIKKTINNQIDIDEPSEATLRAREAQGFKGTKALIVTGQMRNAITYVVKGED